MANALRINNTYCSVPQCRSWKKKDPNVSFHRFPEPKKKTFFKHPDGSYSERNQRAEWIRLLRIGKKVTKFMYVCSRHFKKSDYFPTHEGKQVLRPKLKRHVPSMNLPVTPEDIKLKDVDEDSAQPLKENLPKKLGENCVIRDCPNYTENYDANTFVDLSERELMDKEWTQQYSGISITKPLRSLICSRHFKEVNSETDQKSETNQPHEENVSVSRNRIDKPHYPSTGSDNYLSQNIPKRKRKMDENPKPKLHRRKQLQKSKQEFSESIDDDEKSQLKAEVRRLKKQVKDLEAENASLRKLEAKTAEDMFGHIFTKEQIQLLLSMKQQIHFNNEELALLLFGS